MSEADDYFEALDYGYYKYSARFNNDYNDISDRIYRSELLSRVVSLVYQKMFGKCDHLTKAIVVRRKLNAR